MAFSQWKPNQQISWGKLYPYSLAPGTGENSHRVWVKFRED